MDRSLAGVITFSDSFFKRLFLIQTLSFIDSVFFTYQSKCFFIWTSTQILSLSDGNVFQIPFSKKKESLPMLFLLLFKSVVLLHVDKQMKTGRHFKQNKINPLHLILKPHPQLQFSSLSVYSENAQSLATELPTGFRKKKKNLLNKPAL